MNWSMILIALWFWQNAKASNEENRLRATFVNISNMQRPVLHFNSSTKLEITINMRSIDDMDEKKQLLSTTSWLRLNWNSELHRWNKSEYGGLDEIFYLPGEIWTPDIVLYNSASQLPLFSTIRSPISVASNGDVLWATPFPAVSACTLDVTYYPFDNQQCELTFGVWTRTANQINVTIPDGYVPVNEFLPSGTFLVESIKADRTVLPYKKHGVNREYPLVHFHVRLQRRTQYYIKGTIAPSLLLGALGVITFLLPAQCGERVGFCVTLLLALMVLLLVVSEQIPETSDSYPIIARFLELMLLSLTTALFISCLTLKFLFHKTDRVSDIPWSIRVFTNQWLSALMLVGWSCNNKKMYKMFVRARTSQREPSLVPPSPESIHCKRLSTKDELISADLQKISSYIDDANETDLCDKEYIKAAKVWDRVFIILYLGLMAGCYMWLQISAPKYNTP